MDNLQFSQENNLSYLYFIKKKQNNYNILRFFYHVFVELVRIGTICTLLSIIY